MNTLNNATASTILDGAKLHAIKQPKFIAQFAQSASAIQAAQKLRAQTFNQEYGVQFDHPHGLDVDDYDPFCLHLNVYDTVQGCLIATTRLLTVENARLTNGFYSQKEFDLSPLLPNLQGRVLEVGRTCVHQDYRSGAAITVLWTALAEYLLAENFAYLIGCASIPLNNDMSFSALMTRFDEQDFVSQSTRVIPKRTMLCEPTPHTIHTKIALPPLLKAYLRMNAKLGGDAYFDEAFSCADIFIVLDVATLAARYAQRFLKSA
ncbi:MAG: GNAT family N-acetyltransferase [Moraxellaceae bacterium]|nr:GNAT family N-acetyltransferase [Moraxellaceae bacterium]